MFESNFQSLRQSATRYLASGFISTLPPVAIEGEQSRLPQNVPLWHVGYFELKPVEARLIQENKRTNKSFYLSLNFLEEVR